MAKIGRNDPCPCGSGRKYKKCCLGTEQASGETSYQELSRTWHELMNDLLSFAANELGRDGFQLAIEDFFGETWEPTEENAKELATMFWPWFFFNWYLEPEDIEDGDTAGDLPQETTPAELYLAQNRRNMDQTRRELCTAALHSPYSFREVLQVWQGSGFKCRDLLTGVEDTVSEHQATSQMQEGDILFNQLIRARGHSMIVGYAPIRIPRDQKPQIVRIRSEIQDKMGDINEDLLTALGNSLRTFFLNLYSLLLQGPTLTNTDGDELSFRTLRFEVDSPQEAFEALHPLCCEQSRQELLDEAELDEKERLHKVRIPWSREKGGENPLGEVTLLGEIHIEGTSLVAEVNSQAREERLRGEIEGRLGSAARYLDTEITSREEMMRRFRESPPRETEGESDSDPMDSPEVQEVLAEKIRAHWREWMDTQVPALGDITPREAVRDPNGRESVVALLSDAEATSPGKGLHEAQKEAIRQVRQELGLG